MVEYATSKGLSVRINSNLNRTTSVQARLMVESGLEELLVDLDGATQETYERYRIGGKLALVVGNVRQIVEVKRQLKSPLPLITARTLLTRHNESEVPHIKALAWNLGVDRFWTGPVYVNVNCPEDISEWVPEARRSTLAQLGPSYLWTSPLLSPKAGVGFWPSLCVECGGLLE